MATFKSVVTKLGQASIAAAIQSGKNINIIEMAIGDGGGQAVQPVITQAKLVNEVYRTKLNSLKLDAKNANWVIAEAIISASVGGFWMREMGLYADDGTLIAVCNMADTYKPTLAEGSGRTQTLRMVITVTDTSSVSLTIDDTLIIATEEYVNGMIAAHEKSRNHPDGSLTEKGFLQLSNATNSDSEMLAATPKAVKAANDNANGRLPAGATAVAAQKLSAVRYISGVPFDGTKDISITAGNVGALPSSGGDTAYINNSAHYAIKPGTWEGLGSFANQFAAPFAPFVVPRGFAAGRGFSQYHPLVKGILETQSLGYAGAVSFGALTTGNANFPLAAINVTSDSGVARAWTFDPADGSFVSEGDIGSRKNIVATGAVYESGGTVRVYSPNYRPTPADIGALHAGGTAVAAQKLSAVRYISGVPFDGTKDISITAGNVGALPSSGGDTAYINNSAHYAIKPGTWEGAGAFADQLYMSAPFVVPRGFQAISGASQYNPIVKATIGTQIHDYTAAVSFGALTTGNANFPIATIHVVSDGGLSQAWMFNPADGSFTSPGDVGSSKNIIAAGAVYESGGNVRVYSPNYRPTPGDIGAYNQRGGQLDGDMNATGVVTSGLGRDIASGGNVVATGGVFDAGVRVYSRNNKPTPGEIGAIQTDTCSAAGFAAGDPQVPYLRNSANNEVVTLARWDWVSNTFVRSDYAANTFARGDWVLGTFAPKDWVSNTFAPKDWVSNTFAPRDWVSNTFIGRDSCSYAGFASGNAQAPYMQHLGTNEVVNLARQDWVYGNFITRITRGAQASMVMDGDLVEAPSGCVLTGGNGNEGNQVGYALYRPLMIMRAGTWLTIEG